MSLCHLLGVIFSNLNILGFKAFVHVKNKTCFHFLMISLRLIENWFGSRMWPTTLTRRRPLQRFWRVHPAASIDMNHYVWISTVNKKTPEHPTFTQTNKQTTSASVCLFSDLHRATETQWASVCGAEKSSGLRGSTLLERRKQADFASITKRRPVSIT